MEVILPVASWAYASGQREPCLDGHLVGSYCQELPRGADAVGPGNPGWSPARRTDGSGRRTAGRWVAPPAVAAVRSSGLRVVGRDSSRARLGKAVGVPRGADDPQGPNRPGAGGFASRPPGRGPWGLSLSEFGSSSPGARARIGHLPRRDPPSSIRRAGPHRPPLVLVRADPPVRTLGRRLAVGRCPSHGRFGACRRPSWFCRAVRRALAGRLLARVPAVTAQRP
jgi:hypothetical protein